MHEIWKIRICILTLQAYGLIWLTGRQIICISKICSPVTGLTPLVEIQCQVFTASSACVWQHRSMKAVGNRNTMAATLSLTQVTLSYNSNITTANVSWLLSVVLGDISTVLVQPGGQKCELTSTLVSLFWSLVLLWLGKKFLPNLFGDCVRA